MATTGGQQAGFADSHAGIWTGTAESFVSLHPVNAVSSVARDTTGLLQAGYAFYGGYTHAGIWHGTTESFVDMNPAGSSNSEIHATTDNQQVGFAIFGNETHAGIWFGSADSFLDLDASLGGNYGDSLAQDVWTDGSSILVAGQAEDIFSKNTHAILWTITPVPEPNTLTITISFVLLAGYFARKKT